MKRARATATVLHATVAATLLALAGCQGWDPGWWTWFDPSQTVRKPEQSLVNPIFSQIGPTDPTPELVPNATLPTPEDLTFREEDYVIGPSDVLRISILDLFQQGLESVLERQVSDSGYIDLPLLANRVKATGQTQDQLTEQIKRQYGTQGADILKDATVSVTVVVARQSIFSTLGAIMRPGTYPIPQKKFTLLEALAMAGDVTQTNIEWIYVIRPVGRAGQAPAAAAPEELPEEPALPKVAPTRPATGPTTKGAQTLDEQLKELERYIPGPGASASPRGGGAEPVFLSAVSVSDGPPPATTAATVPSDLEEAARMEKWAYSGGRWVRVPQAAGREEVVPTPEDPFGWRQFDMSHLARIIAINLPKLKAAEARMNIIIRNGDVIQVPPLEGGEFYIMGEVLRPGAYSLMGRRVTLKQAVAAAGNFGALSWPNNSVLIRRIGRDQEQMMAVHLNEIFAGREADVYLKPDDIVAVGSHWSTPFLAVWRNAFRMTYGFGFIYDRNYSERDFEIPLIAPSSGWRLLRH